MTDLQAELWNDHGAQFLMRLGQMPVGQNCRLQDIFGADWQQLGDGHFRQNIGRAISAAFCENHPDIDQLRFQQTQIDGTSNRMQYRRLA